VSGAAETLKQILLKQGRELDLFVAESKVSVAWVSSRNVGELSAKSWARCCSTALVFLDDFPDLRLGEINYD
jgi:hypothetical protein